MAKKTANTKLKKRVFYILIGYFALTLALVGRTAFIQLFTGEDLRAKAIEQQTMDTIISSKRGAILDRNGKPLAQSASAQTVVVVPKAVGGDKKTSADVQSAKDEVSKKLSEILVMDYSTVKAKIDKNSSYEIVQRRIEPEQSAAILALKTNDQTKKLYEGIRLVEDSKRYYTYGSFASQVIGFTGTDNQGLLGIEMVFDKQLKGIPGRIITSKSADNKMALPNTSDRFVDAQNGDNVVLTIDESIQHFVENRLESGRIENRVQNGAAAIVMDPKTGEILAMATKPDFDLNSPFKFNDPAIQTQINSLTGEARSKLQNDSLQKMWRNKAVADSYEPGSVFKIVTASMGIEQNVVSLDDKFFCGGSKSIAGINIACWKSGGHGSQNFVQGVQNSCNPVFMEVGARVGAQNFIKYFYAFGFGQKTGLELPGETTGVFYPASRFNEVELATSSFGQGPVVTPLQLVSAVSAVANGGNLMKPHIVREVKKSDGNVSQSFAPQVVRQVISSETSEKVRYILEKVVSDGTGRNAYIKGYRVAGKTGTSEKLPRNSGKKIVSFVGFAPADNPRVVALVMLDEPPSSTLYSGGTVVAPIVRDILQDTLNYLGVPPEYTDEESKKSDIVVPQTKGANIEAAKKIITDQKLKYRIEGKGTTVVDQIPKANIALISGGTVVLYTEAGNAATSAVVPNIVGKNIVEANSIIINARLNIKVADSRTDQVETIVTTQDPPAGAKVPFGSIVNVTFKHIIGVD